MKDYGQRKKFRNVVTSYTLPHGKTCSSKAAPSRAHFETEINIDTYLGRQSTVEAGRECSDH
jgi:hypothetical protein